MGKKHKCPPEGAPGWMCTFADMMTLLMCFFVLLVAMSTITETKLIAAMGSFRAHLGFMPNQLRVLAILKNTNTNRKVKESVKKKGVKGKHVRVMTVREGDRIVLGGRLTFNPGSAEIRQEAVPELIRITDTLRGYRNIIEITGHTSAAQLSANSPFKDNWELSWERAMAIGRFFIEEGKINPKRLRTKGAGQYDPAADNLFADGQDRNRRVEILVSNKVIKN